MLANPITPQAHLMKENDTSNGIHDMDGKIRPRFLAPHSKKQHIGALAASEIVSSSSFGLLPGLPNSLSSSSSSVSFSVVAPPLPDESSSSLLPQATSPPTSSHLNNSGSSSTQQTAPTIPLPKDEEDIGVSLTASQRALPLTRSANNGLPCPDESPLFAAMAAAEHLHNLHVNEDGEVIDDDEKAEEEEETKGPQLNATEEEDLEEKMREEEKTRVLLTVRCDKTQFGESLYVVGEWINWDSSKALQLVTSGADWPNWKASFKAKNITCSEYKYFILGADGKTRNWEILPVSRNSIEGGGVSSDSSQYLDFYDNLPRNRLFSGQRVVNDIYGELMTEEEAIAYSNSVDYPIPISTLAKSQFKVCKAGFRGTLVAMKTIPMNCPKAVKQAMNEAEILHAMDHSCIVRIFSAYYDATDDLVAIIEEYMTRGSLSNLMYKENRQFNVIQKLRILLQVSRALEYLHNLGLIHRDVKSPNVLLDDDVNAKLCDFGITRREGSMYEKMTKIGTPLWMAPEVFMSKHYNCKADIYSLGVVMYEVMEQELPPDRLDPVLIRPNQNILAKLIRQCLDASPNNRPTSTEVKVVLQNAITDHCKKIVLHRNVQPTRESFFEVYEEYKRQLPW